MPITGPTLLVNLDPAAASTRAFSANARRPWTAGYNARAQAAAAGRVFGFNLPNFRAAPGRRIVLVGAGAAAAGSPFTYTMPAGAQALPTDTDLTAGSAYLNAVMRIYAPNDAANAALVERVATSGANVTSRFFRVQTSTTISLAYGHDGSNFTDLPAGWIAEIIVPEASAIGQLVDFAAAGQAVVSVRDFMAAGDTSRAGAVQMNRIFQ